MIAFGAAPSVIAADAITIGVGFVANYLIGAADKLAGRTITHNQSSTDGAASTVAQYIRELGNSAVEENAQKRALLDTENAERLPGACILRDLNSINSAAKSTRFIFTISLIIPLFMGCGAWALATGAAPGQSLHENYLGLLGLGIASIAVVALPIPYLFRWDWNAKYFGAGMLSLSSGSIIGIYPILCITQYSSLPILVRSTFALVEGILIIRWCLRFVNTYNTIYCKKELFYCIYAEESSAFYYSQQADKMVLEKILKFEQFPHPKYFILSGLAAISLIPFATSTSQFMGIPFIHIFLSIFATPLNLMLLGLSTKGWLVFYCYPKKIKRETNKPVYVDISSQPPKCMN